MCPLWRRRPGAPAGRPTTPVPPSTSDDADEGAWHEDPWDAAPDVDEVEALRPERHVAKWVSFGALALVNVLIIAAGFAGWWYVRQANPAGGVGAPVAVQVAEGETLHDLSVQLEGLGIVQSASFFRRYVDDHGGLTPVAGLYNIPTGDHVGNVLRRLRTPPSETITRVTFPEGFTLRQMAARLGRQDPAVRRRLVPAARHHRHIDRLGVPPGRESPRSRACCSPPPTRCPTPTPSAR